MSILTIKGGKSVIFDTFYKTTVSVVLFAGFFEAQNWTYFDPESGAQNLGIFPGNFPGKWCFLNRSMKSFFIEEQGLVPVKLKKAAFRDA